MLLLEGIIIFLILINAKINSNINTKTVGGHYNRAKTVAENLKLSPALLSRFDLVFIMIDTPNEESDMFLSDHIMKRHRRSNSSTTCVTQCNVRSESVSEGENNTLSSRLRPSPQELPIDLIPHQLIKIYLAYARRYVFPKLLPEAAETIKSFYLELRSVGMSEA